MTSVAGFWRRLTALVIDYIIVSVPTLLLGLALFRRVAGLGPAGRLIGFVVALLYFGVLNSRFGGGQTLGKRLLGIRVIDRSGKPLSPIRSVLRFLVIAIPYFLNGLWFDVNAASAGPVEYMISALVVFVVFGGLGAIVYLFVFNRSTRQSLHDLAVGSFVVRGPPAAVPVGLSTPHLHLIVIGSWLGIALIVPGVGIWAVHEYGLTQSPEPLGELQAAIKTRLGIRQVEVTIGRTTEAAGRRGISTSYLEVDAQHDGKQQDLDALLPLIARTVLDLRPDLLGNQVLIVQLQRRLDLGIASWSETRREEVDAAAWRENNLALRNCLRPTTSEPELSAKLESCSNFIERKNQSRESLALALSSRASIELSRDDHSKALADFDSALALNANLYAAVVGRATTLVNSGQSERALPDFGRAIALHPSDPKLYVGRGDAFNNLKRYDQGIADFDHALALDPLDDEALNDRATALFAKGQYAEAIRGFDAALELATSRRATVLGNRCHAKVMTGDFNGFADCDASLKLEPGNADRLAGRGFFNLKGERFAAAIADYDAALGVNPKDPFALYGRGVARLRLGQTAAGRADIVAAEQIQPNEGALMLKFGISTPTVP